MKKLKKLLKLLLIITVLLTGIITGLFIGGGIYDLADSIKPFASRVPLIGNGIYVCLENLEAPMTGYERRKAELEEKDRYLRSKMQEIDEKEKQLEKERKTFEELKISVEEKEASLDKRLLEIEKQEEEKIKADPGIFYDSFAEINAAKAAGILSRIPLEESVSILASLDSEQRADILSRMEPALAAKIIRYVSGGDN